MKYVKDFLITTGLILAVLATAACDGGDESGDQHTDVEGGHAEGEAPQNPNLIAIPSAVRSNLGISFVEVERRRVEKTLRVPGRFEYQPTAQREYRTPMPGRVELLVDQFQRVEAGELLYRIDAPGWRELQQQLAEAGAQIDRRQAQIKTFGPLLEAHEEHEQSLRETIDVWTTRIKRLTELNEAGGGRVDELTQARASLLVRGRTSPRYARKKLSFLPIKSRHERTFGQPNPACITWLMRQRRLLQRSEMTWSRWWSRMGLKSRVGQRSTRSWCDRMLQASSLRWA